MDILRSIFDLIADWGQSAENQEFATGCGCGCLVLIVVLGALFGLGLFVGSRL